MTPEQRLWQAVVYQALIDATYTGEDQKFRQAKAEADEWLRRPRTNFRMVCALAGMDPDFIHEAYVAGRVDGKLLRCAKDAA